MVKTMQGVTNMFFVGYQFELLNEDTIIMDSELTADKLKVSNGDKFIVDVTSDGQVILKKVKDERSNRPN